MQLSDILAIIALVITVIGGGLIQMLYRRAYKVTDDAIKNLQQEVTKVDQKVLEVDSAFRMAEKDLVRLQECTRNIDELRDKLTKIDSLRAEFLEKYQQKADFIRELESLTNQITAIYKKIDHLDEKLDRKSRRGTPNE